MTVGELQTIDGILHETILDTQGNEVQVRTDRKKQQTIYSYTGTNTAQDNVEFGKIVSAINNTSGGVIEIQGDVQLTASHNITVPFELRGKPGGRLVLAGNSAEIIANRYTGPWVTPALTEHTLAATSAGQSYVSFAVAPGIDENDMVYLAVYADNEFSDVGRDNSSLEMRPLEVHRIVKPVRTTGGVYSTTDFEIDGFIWDALTTTPRAAILPMMHGVVIRDLAVIHSGANTSNSAFRFGMLAHATLENVEFQSPAPGEVLISYCHEVNVRGCSFLEKYDPDESAAESGEGYGITMSACNLVSIQQNYFTFMRHGITIGSSVHSTNGQQYGVTRCTEIRGNRFTTANSRRATDTIFSQPSCDSHAGSAETLIADNSFCLENRNPGANTIAIITRGRNTLIRGNTCMAANEPSGGIGLQIPIFIYGPRATVQNNIVENCWHGIKTDDIGTTYATTDECTFSGNKITNTKGYGIDLHFGVNHVIEKNDITGVTSGAVRMKAGVTGCKVRNNYMPAGTNTKSIVLDGADTTALDATEGFVGNNVPGYAGCQLGFDRATTDGKQLDSQWLAENVTTPAIVKLVTGHSLDIADDMYAPITRAGAVADDTADSSYEGLLQSISGDELCFHPIGAQITLTDGRLPGSGSYSPGVNDRLYWDDSLTDQDGNPGAYVFTRAGDSVLGPVLRVVDQIGTNPGGYFVCQVLEPTGVGGGGGGAGGTGAFTTLALMKAYGSLETNTGYSTLGYYVAGDGGNEAYVYRSTGRAALGFTLDEGHYVTGNGADDYFEAVNKTIIDAKKFGAKGDGDTEVTDDTTPFLNMVGALRRSGNEGSGGYKGATVRIPGGFYRLTKTINFTNMRAYEIEGAGRIAGQNLSHPNPGFPNAGSVLMWDRQQVSVTFTDAGDIWNAVGHGFADDDIITLRGTTLPTGFLPDRQYYVRDATADTFKLAIVYDSGNKPVQTGTGSGSGMTVEFTGPLRMGSNFGLRNIALWGAPPQAAATTRGSIGMLIPPRGGIATGNCYVTNCSFEQFDAGVQLGIHGGDPNCENFISGWIQFSQSGVGYRVMNSQAVGHQFDFVNSYYTDTVFQFRAGGKFKCDYVSMIKSSRVIDFNLNDDGGGGGWVGPFDFGCVLIDGAMDVTPQIVNCDTLNVTSGISVHIGSVTWPNSGGCRPDGRSMVSVDGSWNVWIDRVERWPITRTWESTDSTYTGNVWTGFPEDVQAEGEGSARDMFYRDGNLCKVSSTGALPGNLSADTWYYMVNVNDTGTPATSTFQLAATRGGAAITGADGTGTLSVHTKSIMADLHTNASAYHPRLVFDFVKFNDSDPPSGYFDTDVAEAIIVDDDRYAYWEINNPIGATNNFQWRRRWNRRFTKDYGKNHTINVKDFGAIGNNSNDDTAAFNLAIEEWKYLSNDTSASSVGYNKGSKFYIPAGNYRIASTLDFDNIDGIICGDGMGYQQGSGGLPSSGNPVSASVLAFTGGAGEGPMINIGGGDTVVIRDLAFWGAPYAQTTDYADAGIMFDSYSYACKIDNCTFSRLGIGVQNGTGTGSSWADALNIGHVVFNDCDAGYKNETTNANGIHIDHIQAYDTGDVVLMHGGGHLNINAVNIQNVNNVLYCKSGEGSFTGGMRIGQVRIDNSQDRTPTVYRHESGYGCIIDQVTVQSQSNSTIKYDGFPLFALGNTGRLIVNNLDWFNGSSTGTSTVTFTDVGDENMWNKVDHELEVGMMLTLTTTDTLPTGYSPGEYYVVAVPDADTFQLSTTPGGAVTGGTADDSGTHSIERFAVLLSAYSSVSSYHHHFILRYFSATVNPQPSWWYDANLGGRLKSQSGKWEIQQASSGTEGDEMSPIGNIVGLVRQCSGTPESQVPAPVGSMCIRRDGGNGTVLYIKETGTGDTGWKSIADLVGDLESP